MTAAPSASSLELSPRELLRTTTLLRRSFYNRPTVEVARDLLGCVLVHRVSHGLVLAGTIVEVEAYLGLDDLAAHASRGITPRTRVIFGPPGRAYVYFIYGMYECLNIVAEREGTPGCVLIRAVEPITGIAEMQKRRGASEKHLGHAKLANGPGKLTQALGITRSHYGHILDSEPLTVRRFKSPPAFDIEITPRIGITQCADWPLRFLWRGNPCVSR